MADLSFKLPSPLIEINFDREARGRCHKCHNMTSGCVGCRHGSYDTLRICPPCCAILTSVLHIEPQELFRVSSKPRSSSSYRRRREAEAAAEIDAMQAAEQQQQAAPSRDAGRGDPVDDGGDSGDHSGDDGTIDDVTLEAFRAC